MDKFKRSERVAAIFSILVEHPNRLFTYQAFEDRFAASKTTISEDVAILRQLVKRLDSGEIVTQSGAAGGVLFQPHLNRSETETFLNRIGQRIMEKERLIAGGFIYMTDLLNHPNTVFTFGKIFASRYANRQIDYVVTVETKGIPVALATARILNVPMVTIRKNIKVTEGTTVNINYRSGSTGQIQTMSLSKRAIPAGARVLLIDDFMRGGGTLRGMIEMVREFEAIVEGIGVLVATEEPDRKLVEDYYAMFKLISVDEQTGEVVVRPNVE